MSVTVEGAPHKRPIQPALLTAFALQDLPGFTVKLSNGNTVSSSIITRTIFDMRIMQLIPRPSIAISGFGDVPMPLSAVTTMSLPPPAPSRIR